jgi:fermentation-respiration switch protein FrsA (DUF1100 family)
MRARAMTWLIAIAGIYLALCAAAFFLQRQFLYFPMGVPPAPAEAGLKDFAAAPLETADGLRLAAWWKSPPGESAPVVVLFHGNAGSIADRVFKAEALAQAGFGVLLVEYRGYGGNPGRPSETGFYEDARAAARFLETRGIARRRWVLYGESIGAGPAVQLAQELAASGTGTAGGVVLEAAFTSTADIAAGLYWFLPMRLLIRDRFDNLGKIASIGAPLLIVHGEHDEIVPVAHARRLHATAREPKALKIIANAGHNDLWGPEAATAVIDFARSLSR